MCVKLIQNCQQQRDALKWFTVKFREVDDCSYDIIFLTPYENAQEIHTF